MMKTATEIPNLHGGGRWYILTAASTVASSA
jgi:hypothetical protein